MRNRFTCQAEQFDQRAGLPAAESVAVAEKIIEIGATLTDGLLLEIGAGTGQIGQYLQSRFRYVGIDSSNAMLQVFRSRTGSRETEVELLEADANQRWPVVDRSVAMIFSSRTLHLLDAVHLFNEIVRVIAVGSGALVVGRVQRSSDSVKTQMRKQMRSFLRELGVHGRGGEKSRQDLLDMCCENGGALLEPIEAASWECEHTPLQSIVSWEKKRGLAGIDVSAEVKRAVLDRLRNWAVQNFGDLQRPSPTRESYLLEGVRFNS